MIASIQSQLSDGRKHHNWCIFGGKRQLKKDYFVRMIGMLK